MLDLPVIIFCTGAVDVASAVSATLCANIVIVLHFSAFINYGKLCNRVIQKIEL